MPAEQVNDVVVIDEIGPHTFVFLPALGQSFFRPNGRHGAIRGKDKDRSAFFPCGDVRDDLLNRTWLGSDFFQAHLLAELVGQFVQRVLGNMQAMGIFYLNPAISTSVCPNAARLSNFWKLMFPKRDARILNRGILRSQRSFWQ